ncbi:MAG: winged helix-turn-helix domain-containing protein, partial [Acidobacteria bacterium]|nr:winged helix-turn-helix domain-containing protein [Acidobacteriota bacterium]
IVRLRKYIEEVPSKPRHLLTVRSVGYRFVAESMETKRGGQRVK